MKLLLLLFGLGPSAVLLAQTNTNVAPAPNPPALMQLSLPAGNPLSLAQPFIPSTAPFPNSAPPDDPLIQACVHDDLKKAGLLLDHGASLDVRDKYGNTPLMLAAMRDPEMVKLILAHHPALEARQKQSYTALDDACMKGKTACAIELMDAGADIESVNVNDHTPLILAVESGQDDVVKALIDHHVDVNRDSKEGSAIWWAVGKDRLAEATMLFAAGADLQFHIPLPIDPHRTLLSALGMAAKGTDTALIDLLLAHGATINETDTLGRTPLMMALGWSNPAMVDYLLGKGADAKTADHQGKTVFMYAVEYQQQPVWEEMLQRGAVVEAKDSAGKTALMYACQNDLPSAATWLLDHGADVNATDAHNETPFLFAGSRGATTVMDLLKQRGAKPQDLRIIPQDMPSPPLSDAHRWALGVCALYSQWNGENPNILGGGMNPHQAKNILRQDWRIQNREDLIKTVDFLQRTGSRVRFRRQGVSLKPMSNFVFWLLTWENSKAANESRAIHQNYLTWGDRTGLAGDLCRAANLVNLGYACHYLNEDQAWNFLIPIAQDTQAHFVSWHEMADNFLDSREMWTGVASPGLDVCGDLLCNPKDPNSPWNQIPWSTALSQ